MISKKYADFVCLISFLSAVCGSNDAIPGKDFKVTIIEPSSSQFIIDDADDKILFRGEAYDHYQEGGDWHKVDIKGSDLAWTSSLDGPLGIGEIFEKKLSPGEHVITLTVVGVNDRTASTSITVTVIE